MPDEDWCIERLMAIVNDPKVPAAARVAAIGMIGKIRKIPGLSAGNEDAGGSGKVPAVMKVILGVDPKDI